MYAKIITCTAVALALLAGGRGWAQTDFSAGRYSPYYNEDEWYDPEDWFDRNNYEYDDFYEFDQNFPDGLRGLDGFDDRAYYDTDDTDDEYGDDWLDQAGYKSEDEWYDPTDWFDANSYEYGRWDDVYESYPYYRGRY